MFINGGPLINTHVLKNLFITRSSYNIMLGLMPPRYNLILWHFSNTATPRDRDLQKFIHQAYLYMSHLHMSQFMAIHKIQKLSGHITIVKQSFLQAVNEQFSQAGDLSSMLLPKIRNMDKNMCILPGNNLNTEHAITAFIVAL